MIKLSSSKWSPPAPDALKFNIDDVVSSSLGPAGTGGVLRNQAGKILCYFSINMGIIDAPTLELLAIKDAGILLKSSNWSQSHRIIFNVIAAMLFIGLGTSIYPSGI